MGSKQKWADLRPLIEKGFELSGSPIAKLPPQEEKLWFAKRHTGKHAKPRRRSRMRRAPKVAMGAVTALPGKKKSNITLKKKSKKKK